MSRMRQNNIEAHILIHNGAEFMMMMTTAGKRKGSCRGERVFFT